MRIQHSPLGAGYAVAFMLFGPSLFSACGSDAPTDGTFRDAGRTDSGSKEDASSTLPGFGSNDAGLPGDAAKCGQVNIGILGNPGPLPSSNFQSWLVASGTSAKRIQQVATTPLTAAEIAEFDVLILDALVRDYTPDEANIFESWVASGKGVISMTGYTDSAIDLRANTLIDRLGVKYATPQLSGPITAFVPHPITAGLTSVSFQGGYRVIETEKVTQRTALASIGGVNTAYAIQASAGRGFVWGDEWIEYDSEWGMLPQIKQLWVNVFAWLAPEKCRLEPPK